MQKIKIGQRWNYQWEQYQFIVEIKEDFSMNGSMIIQTNRYSVEHYYPIGKIMNHPSNSSSWTYLKGQDRV